MKDQVKLLRKCINNDVPAIVFQGDDLAAVEILEGALKCYSQIGCEKEFLIDFKLLINEFKAYQEESPQKVKKPKLTETEKFLIKKDMVDEIIQETLALIKAGTEGGRFLPLEKTEKEALSKATQYFKEKYCNEQPEEQIVLFVGENVRDLFDGYKNDEPNSRENYAATLFKCLTKTKE